MLALIVFRGESAPGSSGYITEIKIRANTTEVKALLSKASAYN